MRTSHDELQRIAAAHNGLLRAADVVDEATPEAAPLHPYFEWDDTEAGRLYRLRQADHLIRATVVMVNADEPRMTRCYVSLTSDRGAHGVYREVRAVLSNPDHRAQLLKDAYREMEAFRRKYRDLRELVSVLEPMEEMLTSPSVAVA